MPKIAIIKGHDADRYENDRIIIDSITDWTEVSDEDLKTLNKAKHRMGFTVLEQPIDQPAFIGKTVNDYLRSVERDNLERKRDEEKRQKEANKRKEAAKLRKLQREAKTAEEAKAVIEDLKRRFPDA